MDRLEFTESADKRPVAYVQYFQFSRNEAERKIHFVQFLLAFAVVLDVFSDFLVNELKTVPTEWQNELRDLGKALERGRDQLNLRLPPDAAA